MSGHVENIFCLLSRRDVIYVYEGKNNMCLDMLDSPGHGTTGHNKNFFTGPYRGTTKQNYLSKSYNKKL